MKRWYLRPWIQMLGVLLLVGGLHTSAYAQEPERQRAFVYGINAAIAKSYTGSFVPPSVKTIYLLADQTSIIAPRITQIYFWPITNEYKASWELLNQSVDGTLEIRQNGQIIQQTAVTSYTIQYTPNGKAAEAQLTVGAEADAAQARFTALQKAYQEARQKHYEAERAWTLAMEDVNRRREAGEQVEAPPEPVAPALFSVVSNGINQGVPVKLPAGTYQIRLRAKDGAIVAGSDRDLVVFGARRSAIGYQVVPETRWTTPDQVDDLSDVIIGKANSKIYLIPHYEQEFPARDYGLVENPQQQIGETTDWKWVLGDELSSGALELLVNGQPIQQLSLTPFRVKQVAGTTLGYEIQEFIADPAKPAKPDLVAYPIQIAQPGSGLEIRMRAASGEIMPGSTRLVRTPADMPLGTLLLLSLCPIGLGAIVILRRRIKMRLPRNIAG